MKRWLKLILLIYSFILSIELIKNASSILAPNIKSFLFSNLTPLKAVSLGWFATAIAQSSGAIDSIATALVGNSLIPLQAGIYILIGASLGTTITAMAISVITLSKQRRDFRHGFEIGLCYAIYSATLILIVLFLEIFFKFFSRTSLFLAGNIKVVHELKIPNIIDFATNYLIHPLFQNFRPIFILTFGLVLLIFTLKYVGKSVIEVFGGEDKARSVINKYFDSKYKSYFLGASLTAILFSSSITTGLLVPLAVSRIISLKKAIPFIIGAGLGTFADVFLAALIVGKTSALAVAISGAMFEILGAIIFLPNIDRLEKVTKYTSKHLIKISRKKALYVLIAFILTPLLLFLIL